MPDEIRQADASAASASAAAPAVLVALRAATRDRHERLHQLMPLSADSAGLDDYLAHLRILRAWLAPLEPWLAAHPDGLDPDVPDVSDAPPAARLALIDADLAAGPAGARAMSAGPASAAPWWPAQADAAYRWGARYVIEGSQMGGAVLYAQLRERLAPHPLGFLAAGRDGLSARWKAFVRRLAAEVDAPAAIASACRGATDAFDRLVVLAGVAHAVPGAPA